MYWFAGLGNIAFDKWLFALNGTMCLSKLRIIFNYYFFFFFVKPIQMRGKCKISKCLDVYVSIFSKQIILIFLDMLQKLHNVIHKREKVLTQYSE